MEKNIILVGLMGAGKSSIGIELSKYLGFEFYDTDMMIELEQNIKISQIFSTYGEEYFRNLETVMISKVSSFSRSVISTGGGSIQNVDNLVKLKQNGVVFYLKACPEILFERVKDDNNRPLLQTSKPLEVLKELLIKREKNYMLADVVIETDNKTLIDIVEKIVKEYNARA